MKAQNITQNVTTLVQLNTENFDVQNEFVPYTAPGEGRFTVDVAGKYIITGTAGMNNLDDGEFIQVLIYVNGGEVSRMRMLSPAANRDPFACTTTIEDLGVGDFVELYVRHDSTGALAISTGRSSTFLALHKVA